MMKLYYSANSPFVRKVVIAAEILGLTSRMERIPATADPMSRVEWFRRINPSGQLPTFVTDEGLILYGSSVVCEYLDTFAGGTLIGEGGERWRNLRDAATGDTLAEAALQLRYETALRPAELRWENWSQAWRSKIDDALSQLEVSAGEFGDRMDMGVIAIFCALAYLDWRLPEVRWKEECPELSKWFGFFRALPQISASFQS